jgi:hypothetical protein
MSPQDEKTMLMQRMEDSSLRLTPRFTKNRVKARNAYHESVEMKVQPGICMKTKGLTKCHSEGRPPGPKSAGR